MAHVRRRITVKITRVNAPMAGLVATVNNLVMIRSFLTVASSDSIQRIVDKLFINALLVTKISVYKKGEAQVKMYFMITFENYSLFCSALNDSLS